MKCEAASASCAVRLAVPFGRCGRLRAPLFPESEDRAADRHHQADDRRHQQSSNEPERTGFLAQLALSTLGLLMGLSLRGLGRGLRLTLPAALATGANDPGEPIVGQFEPRHARPVLDSQQPAVDEQTDPAAVTPGLLRASS